MRLFTKIAIPFLTFLVAEMILAVPTARELVPTTAPQGARAVLVGKEMDNTNLTVTFTTSANTEVTATVISRSPKILEVVVPNTAATGSVRVKNAGATIASFTFTLANDAAVTRVSTIAGAPANPTFLQPTGVGVIDAGTKYVADTGHHQIKKIDAAGNVTVLAGSGTPGFTNGTGTAAQFNSPADSIVVDSNGDLIITDSGNHAIRKVTPTGVTTTIAGTGVRGTTDGSTSVARFDTPTGVTVDANGVIYVSDTQNVKIRKIESGSVSTFAGTGVPGFTNGSTAQATFNGPGGIVVTSTGVIYIADTGNHAIRRSRAAQ